MMKVHHCEDDLDGGRQLLFHWSRCNGNVSNVVPDILCVNVKFHVSFTPTYINIKFYEIKKGI